MSAENGGGSIPYHPEVNDDLEAMRPPDQTSLQYLLDLATNRALGGSELVTGFNETLRLLKPDGSIGDMIKAFTYKDDPTIDKRAQITHFAFNGTTKIQSVSTQYVIYESPEGLYAKKCVALSGMPQPRIEGLITPEQAEELEAELGLDFVSQKDVDEMITLLDIAVPHRQPY